MKICGVVLPSGLTPDFTRAQTTYQRTCGVQSHTTKKLWCGGRLETRRHGELSRLDSKVRCLFFGAVLCSDSWAYDHS